MLLSVNNFSPERGLVMSKSLVAALLAACTAFGFSTSAALADTSKEVAKSALEETTLLPVKVLGVATALVGGVPISVLKNTAQNLNTYTDSVATEIKDYEGLSPMVALSLPGELISLGGSCVKGVIDGGSNAFKNWDKPFSAEAFSLED